MEAKSMTACQDSVAPAALCVMTTHPLLPPQTLLSKGVREERILFLTIIAAPEGIIRVSR